MEFVEVLHWCWPNLGFQVFCPSVTFWFLRGISNNHCLFTFLLICSENGIWHFMQIVSKRDNLHEMLNFDFWGRLRNFAWILHEKLCMKFASAYRILAILISSILLNDSGKVYYIKNMYLGIPNSRLKSQSMHRYFAIPYLPSVLGQQRLSK